MRSRMSGAKPGPIIADRDFDRVVVPLHRNIDAFAREIDSVLNQVAEAIDNGRIARADRFGRSVMWPADIDGDAEIAMRRHDFLNQRGQRRTVERLAAR